MTKANYCSEYPNDRILWHKNLYGAYRFYVTPIFGLFGILGNTLVIIIFLLEQKKSRFSIYCIAISFCHIIILITNSMMDDFMGNGLRYWKKELEIKFDQFSYTMCIIMEFVPNCMYTVSSGLLLVFSIDRIVTIFKPMRFYSIHYRKMAIYLCIGVFVLSSVLTLPLLISSELRINSATNYRKCTINDKMILGRSTIFIKVFITFVVPTFMILIVNIVICLRLWRTSVQRKRLLPTDLRSNNIEMNRICGHLALNTVFLMFTFPLVITMLLRQIQPCSKRFKDLSKLFSSLKDIAYSLDLILYIVFLKNFRWRLIRYCIMPILTCLPCFKQTEWLFNIQIQLLKYDSNSSRRKYSALVSGLSNYHNTNVLNALMFRNNNQTTIMQHHMNNSYSLQNSIDRKCHTICSLNNNDENSFVFNTPMSYKKSPTSKFKIVTHKDTSSKVAIDNVCDENKNDNPADCNHNTEPDQRSHDEKNVIITRL